MVGIAAIVLATVTGAARVDAQQEDESLDGADLEEMLTAAGTGSPDIDLADVTIEGPVEFASLQVIDRPIRCTRCTFTGAVSVADVRFGGVVELVDAVFEGPVDARGVVFGRAAVFDGARFEARFDASTARFDSLASFAGADFLAEVSFERTSFGDRAVFTGTSGGAGDRLDICRNGRGSSVGAARFAGATFSGPSQFRERCFAGRADFSGVRFADDAEFSGTKFGSTATFERATFDADASFRVADFGGSASFEGASISATLSFDTAVVRDRLRLEAVGGSGTLALAGADICRPVADEAPDDTSPVETTSDLPIPDPIPPPCSTSPESRLILTRLAVEFVTIDLADVDAIGGPSVRIEVLERVDTTARATGRTGVANDARFELLSRRHAELDQPQRFYDGFFYRDIAGYLVRPTHPLWWFIGLIAFGAVVRTLTRVRGLTRPTHPDRRGAGTASTVIAVVSLFVSGIAETLRTAFSVSLETDDASPNGDDGAATEFSVSLEGGVTAGAPSEGGEGADSAFDVSLVGGAVAVAPAADSGESADDVPSLDASLLDGVRRLEWLAFKVLIAVFLLGVANANSTVKELIDSVI